MGTVCRGKSVDKIEAFSPLFAVISELEKASDNQRALKDWEVGFAPAHYSTARMPTQHSHGYIGESPARQTPSKNWGKSGWFRGLPVAT
jgi:hypothetical protein